MSGGIPTALFGLGKIGAQYALDPAVARTLEYSSHIQVLTGNPRFDLVAAIDPDETALSTVAKEWEVEIHPSIDAVAESAGIELAVIATPPAARQSIVESLPGLRAVMVEKPIAVDVAESEAFLSYCAGRDIAVQVNLWRRADEIFRGLAEGGLSRAIGECQVAFGVYGNGLLNNGCHVVDFIDMMLGGITEVSAADGPYERPGNPLPGDADYGFHLVTASGARVSIMPVDFDHYREVSFDFWGTRGRLEVLVESMITRVSRVAPYAEGGAAKIRSDEAEALGCTVGTALWHMYENLADALAGRAQLCSPGEVALRAERVIGAVRRAAASGRSQRLH